jgi:peptidyl-prolyl cis-trans isomerase C
VIRARLAGAALSLLLLACGGSGPPQTTSSQLPAGFVARAGQDLVSAASVSRIASAQGLPPQQAVSRALSDALFAAAARTSAPPGVASHIERAASARALLEQLNREAGRAGPPTDTELADLVRERWTDLDRPDAVRTVHAIVLDPESARLADARRIAEKIAEAVEPASNGEEFKNLARAVPLEGLEMMVESLPLITSDGRSFEKREGNFVPRGPFDLDFARAANALAAPGQVSPVTRSKFGFHVIRLEERVPGRVVPKTELGRLLGPEVLTRRAARARSDLLERLRKAASVEVDRGANQLTERLLAPP